MNATAEPGLEPHEWSTVPPIHGAWLKSGQTALFTRWIENRDNVLRAIDGQGDTRHFGDDLVLMEADAKHLLVTARLSLSDLELEAWELARDDAHAICGRAVNQLEALAEVLSVAIGRAERYRPATQSTEARAVVLSPAMHLDAKIQELSGKMWSAMVGLDVEAKLAFKLIQERDTREGQKKASGTRGDTTADNGSTSMRHIDHSMSRGAITDAPDGTLIRPRQGGRGDSHATPSMLPTQDRPADGGYSVRRRFAPADETARAPERESYAEPTSKVRSRHGEDWASEIGGREGSQASRNTYSDRRPRPGRIIEDREYDTGGYGNGSSRSGRRDRAHRADRRQ